MLMKIKFYQQEILFVFKRIIDRRCRFFLFEYIYIYCFNFNVTFAKSFLKAQIKKRNQPEFAVSDLKFSKMNALKEGWLSEVDDDLWPGQCFSIKCDELLHQSKSLYQDVIVFRK
jgi:hypothetical protein